MAKYGRQSRVSKENKFRLFYGLSRLLPTRGVVERETVQICLFLNCVCTTKSNAAKNERRGINGNFLAEKLSLIFSRNEAPHYGNAHTGDHEGWDRSYIAPSVGFRKDCALSRHRFGCWLEFTYDPFNHARRYIQVYMVHQYVDFLSRDHHWRSLILFTASRKWLICHVNAIDGATLQTTT